MCLHAMYIILVYAIFYICMYVLMATHLYLYIVFQYGQFLILNIILPFTNSRHHQLEDVWFTQGRLVSIVTLYRCTNILYLDIIYLPTYSQEPNTLLNRQSN